MDSCGDENHFLKDSNATKEVSIATENEFRTRSQLVSQRDPVPQSGINIRQALEILSSRLPNDHTFRNDKNLPPALKSMGQTIDLFAPSPHQTDSFQSPSESMTQTTKTGSSNVNSEKNDTTPFSRRQKIRNGLKDHPFIGLLKMVLTAQEDRVRTYRLYDEALGKVLASNSLTDYPPACVAATAAFSVLSDTVCAIRDELSDRASNKKDPLVSTSTFSCVIKCIGDLQESEREKLQLYAAYHLDSIRANNLNITDASGIHGHVDGDADVVEVDMRELSMLNKGITELRSRIESCKSDINDIIEDLRCALVEQMEEEEDQ